MRLDVYKKCINQGNYLSVVNSLIKEYYNYGFKLGYLDNSNRYKLDNYLRSMKVIFDSSLPGDAKVENNILYINPKFTFRTDCGLAQSEKYASEIIFHELSHLMNSFHDDFLQRDNGLFDIFCDNFHELARRKFNINRNRNVNWDDSNNLDKYPFYAIRLLDEAVSQNVSEDLLAEKYGYNRDLMFKNYSYYHGIKYTSNYNSYGIFQDVVERFSRTLAGVNSFRDLCLLSFHENVSEKILSEHIENRVAFEDLYDEFCYMGLLLFTVYYHDGHANSKLADSKLIYDSYYNLLRILRNGYEGRNIINTPQLQFDKKRRVISW